MKNISKLLVLAAALLMTFGSVQAEKYRGGSAVSRIQPRAAATCLPASNSNQLLVNNVRAYKFSLNPKKFYAFGINGMLNLTFRF